jgi:hypothetical protein
MSTLADPGHVPTQDELEAKKLDIAFATGLLEEARKQRDRLDTRTNILVTCSGALITVVGVLAALLPKQGDSLKMSPGLVATFATAMGLLLAAILVAQGVAIFSSKGVPKGDERAEQHELLLAGIRSMADVDGLRKSICREIQRLGGQCSMRSKGLMWAGGIQLFGVIVLGASLFLFLGSF